MSDNVQAKTKKGLMLRSVESITMQVTNFILQMVLARLLLPEDFGVVAILTTFTNIANTLVNNGLGSAIVQRKDIKQVDICTVFYIELFMGILSYGVIFLAAPWIAEFYENPMICTYLRVFAISMMMIPFASIQITIGKARLDFMPSLVSNLCAVAVHAISGIWLALAGYGVWSLVISQVLNHVVRALMLCLLTRWIPSLQFSFESFKRLFSYSWKLFAGWMIGTLYQDAFSWIIGKAYDSKTLGYYNKGHSIPAIVNRVATQVTSAVMFSSMAKYQDDKAQMKAQTRNLISITCAMIFPVMAGLAACAELLVRTVLTEKWLGAVPVIQIMCLPLALNVISNANMQPVNASGRSDVFLRLEMIKRGITILLVLIFVNINYYLMLLSIAVGGLLSLCVNTYYNNKLFDYRPGEYMMDILPYAACAGVLFLIVSAAGFLPLNGYALLAIQLALCALLYGIFIFSGLLPGYKAIRNTLTDLYKKKARKSK